MSSIPGKEIVQLYISAPARKISKPAEELKAFAKTGLLLPGKSQTITFTLTASDLASFDEKTSSWIAEAGSYIVKIGASSTDIRQTKTCKLDKDLVAAKVSKALSPQVEINELKRQ